MKRVIVGFFGSVVVVISGGIGAAHFPDEPPVARFGPWSAPVNLGSVVNSSVRDAGVSISSDGLSLYFSSARAAAETGTGTDLYVSRRLAIDLPWMTPAPLEMLNSPGAEGAPSLSSDDRYLFFSSIRPGGFGSFDLYVSERRRTRDDFAWQAPLMLPSPPNGPGQEVAPKYVETRGRRPQLYFASSPDSSSAGLDIYVTELRKDGTWSTPEYLAVLNSEVDDEVVAIRFDGLEMIISSRRGGPDLDLYVTRRNHLWDSWSIPENLGPTLNSPSSDFAGSLSSNGRTLYFASNRPDTLGNFDLYASTRSRIR